MKPAGPGLGHTELGGERVQRAAFEVVPADQRTLAWRQRRQGLEQPLDALVLRSALEQGSRS
jgi:hypothetical protein